MREARDVSYLRDAVLPALHERADSALPLRVCAALHRVRAGQVPRVERLRKGVVSARMCVCGCVVGAQCMRARDVSLRA